MNRLEIPEELTWLVSCRAIRRPGEPGYRQGQDFYTAGLDVFRHRADVDDLVRSLVVLRLFPTVAAVRPFTVALLQNIEAYAPDACAPEPFFARVEIPLSFFLRKTVEDRELFTEIFRRARPAVEAAWEQFKAGAGALGRMFVPAAHTPWHRIRAAASPEYGPLAQHLRHAAPPEELWCHLRHEVFMKGGVAVESVVLVDGWPRRTYISQVVLAFCCEGKDLPRVTQDGSCLTIELTRAQARYRIVRRTDTHLDLKLIGCS